jgi:hypothetical protein
MPRPVSNYVYRIVLQFYVPFYVFISHVVSYFFPVSPLVRVVQILSQEGLLEVPATYLGSGVLNGHSS